MLSHTGCDVASAVNLNKLMIVCGRKGMKKNNNTVFRCSYKENCLDSNLCQQVKHPQKLRNEKLAAKL